MSSYQAAADLISDIADAGAALIARPLITDTRGRREEIARLRARLEGFATSGAGARYLTYCAPMLLLALDLALHARDVHADRRAARLDGLVGHLIPLARDDAGDALDAMTAE